MIRNFKDSDAEQLFQREPVKKLPFSIQRTALRKLLMLNAATCLNDLKVPPANRLEILKGNKKGIYSIRINNQWRLCFAWKNNNAYDVEIIDYH